MWRRNNVEKSYTFDDNCLYERLKKKIFMSNIAIFIFVGKIDLLVKKCIKTLKEHSNCEVRFFTIQDELENKHFLDELEISYFEIDRSKWTNRRMTHKIEIANDLITEYQDCVLILDCDLIFQADPFKIFKNDFDIFYTTRYYDYHFSVNAGVWGYRVNNNSKKFLEFYVEQINNPTWPPLIEYREKFNRKNNYYDWWTDQDFLCVINENQLPMKLETVKLFDATYRYNYCPRFETGDSKENHKIALKELEKATDNEEFVILHLKGALKKHFGFDRDRKLEL